MRLDRSTKDCFDRRHLVGNRSPTAARVFLPFIIQHSSFSIPPVAGPRNRGGALPPPLPVCGPNGRPARIRRPAGRPVFP